MSDTNAILEALRGSELGGRVFRQLAMERMAQLDGFDWVGVYRLEGGVLELDAYVGAPTEHTRIEVGVGVCGTAVAQGSNQVVEDVRALENYLACSLDTRSEIVVLIWRGDEMLGQIDVDGHRVGRFGVEEERFLGEVAALISERW